MNPDEGYVGDFLKNFQYNFLLLLAAHLPSSEMSNYCILFMLKLSRRLYVKQRNSNNLDLIAASLNGLIEHSTGGDTVIISDLIGGHTERSLDQLTGGLRGYIAVISDLIN